MIDAEFRPVYFSKDKAPVRISASMEDFYFQNYLQVVNLDSIPIDDYMWNFIWPGGSQLFKWKTTVSNQWEEIEIGADIETCLNNAVTALNSNYYFAKNFTAFILDGDLNIKSKEIGLQFWAKKLADDSITVIVSIFEEDNPLLHKLNYQVGLLLFKYVDGIINNVNPAEIVISEHIAPVVIPSEVDSFTVIEFNIQSPIHSLTEFSPPRLLQDYVTSADGHCKSFKPAYFEIYGLNPTAKEFTFYSDCYVVRGGSRFENQVAWDDFFQEYILSENNGLLSYNLNSNVTLVQEQYRYWYNSLESFSAWIKITIIFKDLSYVTSLIFESPSFSNTIYIIPTGIGRIPGIVEICETAGKTIDDIDNYSINIHEQFTDAFVANLGTYKIIESTFSEKYFLVETSVGGAEVFRCTGENSFSIEISKTEYLQFNVPRSYWQNKTSSQVLVNYKDIYECSTGNLRRKEANSFIELLLSENVFEILYKDDLTGNDVNGYRFPISIEPGTFLITKDKQDGEYLYGFSFKYRRSYEEQSLGLNNNFF